jgi:hypothetical protein
MTATITCIKTRRPLHHDIVAVEPVYVVKPMPSWVTAYPILASIVTWLQMKGWRIEAHPAKVFFCWHPQIVRVNGFPHALPNAYVAQCDYDGIDADPAVLQGMLKVFEGFLEGVRA